MLWMVGGKVEGSGLKNVWEHFKTFILKLYSWCYTINCLANVKSEPLLSFFIVVDRRGKNYLKNIPEYTSFVSACLKAFYDREYWMIYRGPGFLAVLCLGSLFTPFPTPLPAASYLSFSVFLCVAGRPYLRVGGRGAKNTIVRKHGPVAATSST